MKKEDEIEDRDFRDERVGRGIGGGEVMEILSQV